MHPAEVAFRFKGGNTDFVLRFHAARGDSAVRLGKWQRHFKVRRHLTAVGLMVMEWELLEGGERARV